MARLISACLTLAAALGAQTPIRNTGAPMLLPFNCTEEDTRETGLTCSEEQPCGVYVELTGVEQILNRILLAGNFHSIDATLYSVLLASNDGGETWTEPYPRTRFTSLEQIQFIDFETGWVSGSNVQGIPRDPFLLLTGDGGKTWKKVPVFDESRTGVVDKFWFESKTSGTLLIGTKLRYELYETLTGGESWQARQISRTALKLPRERDPADAAIRIRPDGKIHGYQIEKHQGGKWLSIGSFLVEVAKCKQ